MMPGVVSFKKIGWKAFAKALSYANFSQKARTVFENATEKVGLYGVKYVRQAIQESNFIPNEPLTLALKGSSKPLVDTGHGIFQAITHQVVGPFTVFVGILRMSEDYNIATTLHDGAVIPVTDKMRGLFYILWLVSQGTVDESELEGRARELWDAMPGGWKPLKQDTLAIYIPARPFIKQAFGKTELHEKAKQIWQTAVNEVLAMIASEGKGNED